jgi:hypothetical protein
MRGWDIPEFGDDALKPACYAHIQGTDMSDEELKYKYSALLPAFIAAHDVIRCNHKVDGKPGHPFMISSQHFPKDGGMYIDVHQAPCAYGSRKDGWCGQPYEAHTSDKVLVLKLLRSTNSTVLNDALKPLAPTMEADGLDGIAFANSDFDIVD